MLRREVLAAARSTRIKLWLAIALVSAITYAGNRVMHEVGQSKAKLAQMLASETAGAFHGWRAHHSGCPQSIDDLADYTNFDIRRDLWGNRYVIACDGREAVVISPGPDGRLGTPDDVTSY